jgi:hypothetical protein
MPFASANSTQLRYVPEVTFGVSPDTGYKNLRTTDTAGLTYAVTTDTSKEIRSDRQVTDLIITGASASGSIPFELSYGEYDAFLEAALQGTWNTNVLENASTARSFSIERVHTDITQYFLFKGMRVGKFSLSIQSGSVVTGSFDFTGKEGVLSATPVTVALVTASLTEPVINAVSNVGTISVDGSATTAKIKSISLDVDNGLRALDAIGSLGAVDVNSGSFAVTGSLEMYFEDAAMYAKLATGTSFALSWVISKGGKGYTFELPNVKLSDAKPTGGGQNTDVMMSLSFTALMNTTGTGKTIKITRDPVA